MAFKMYPAGATTNSDSGVTDISLVMPTLRTMAQVLAITIGRAPCMLIWQGDRQQACCHHLPRDCEWGTTRLACMRGRPSSGNVAALSQVLLVTQHLDHSREGPCVDSPMPAAQEGILLLVHGEVTDPDVDFFDREKVFIERHLKPLLQQLPELKARLSSVARHGVKSAAGITIVHGTG